MMSKYAMGLSTIKSKTIPSTKEKIPIPSESKN